MSAKASQFHPVVPASIIFHENTLITAEINGEKFVAMKPITEGMGLAWQSQQTKIRQSKRYNDIVMPLQTPSGIQEMVCIPIKKLNGWLFSINTDKVKAEIREKVRQYQEECFVVLYDYWHKGAAVNDRAAAPAVYDSEILQTLLATNQAVTGLREQLGSLVRVAGAMEEFRDTARNICESVEQLSKISHIESAVRNHIDRLRQAMMDGFDRARLRGTNTKLHLDKIEENARLLRYSLDAIEKRMDSEEQSRKGLLGYLEKYLPEGDLADLRSTGQRTPENDPVVFLKESCVLDPFASVEVAFLYKFYKAWVLSRFYKPLGRDNFWDAIRDRLPEGVTVEKRMSRQTLVGIKPAPRNDI